MLAIGAIASPDRLSRLALLLDPTVIAALLAVEAALFAWRLGAVADAFRRGEGATSGRAASLTAIGLVLVLVPSVYAAYLTELAREAALTVFAKVEQPYVPPAAPSLAPDDSLGPPTATFSPPPELGRFTVLLIGADSGPGRDHALTDTMIVASLDPIAHSVSMVSVPRDTVDLPLPDGRIFRAKINSLVMYVEQHPDRFPGAPSGQAVLAATLGQLLGVQVDGWAQVNLPGFVEVVNSLGGIDVNVTDGFCDAGYDEYGINGFAITPGRYHFDGNQALAYARVRKAYGENDFTRAGRQQEIVVAARDRVVGGGFLVDPAGFISAMGRLVTTSIDPSVLAEYAGAASGVSRDHVFRQVIQPPLVHSALEDARGSIQVPDLEGIHDLGVAAFPPPGTLPVGLATIPADPGGPTTTSLPKARCSVPKATPSPTPLRTPSSTPQPIDTPVPSPTDKPGGGPPSPEPSIEPSPPPSVEPSTAP